MACSRSTPMVKVTLRAVLPQSPRSFDNAARSFPEHDPAFLLREPCFVNALTMLSVESQAEEVPVPVVVPKTTDPKLGHLVMLSIRDRLRIVEPPKACVIRCGVIQLGTSFLSGPCVINAAEDLHIDWILSTASCRHRNIGVWKRLAGIVALTWKNGREEVCHLSISNCLQMILDTSSVAYAPTIKSASGTVTCTYVWEEV